jgi:UDP-N-acetylglucosamine transferase subunit ALG13
MIYVTVGSAIGGAEFDRLIKKVDDIAPFFEEEFIVQLGASKYVPINMRWFQYVPYEESLEYFKTARLIIGHCGSGTIINALSFSKPLIVIPRLVRFNENSDDHQLEIAKLLDHSQLARVVYDVEDLESVIRKTLDEFCDSDKKISSIFKENLVTRMKEFLMTIGKAR